MSLTTRKEEKTNMVFIPTLVSLSDNDKRLIFSALLIVIILLVVIALLGYLFIRVMKWQSRKMDTLIHDVVVNKVITDRKHLLRYGRSKNWALFFKQAYIPVIIGLVGAIVLIIHNSVNNYWSYNPFSTYDGFGTLFWTWKSSGNFSGTDTDLVRFQVIVLDNTPHLVASAWAGYIAGPCFLVAGVWYLIVVSSLLSRTILLYKRSKEIFEKSLDGYRQNETSINADSNKPEDNNVNSN